MARFRDTKLYDLLMVTPLIAWYGIAMAGLAPEIGHGFAAHDLRLGLVALSRALTLAFLALQIVLFVLRKMPEGRSPGWRPRAAALIGSNLQLAFLALPQVPLRLPAALASAILVAAGIIGAIIAALCWVGASPSSRRPGGW